MAAATMTSSLSAGCSDAVRSVAGLVRAARVSTGKPARPSDVEFVAWLGEQEVTTAADFYNLSNESLTAMVQAPGASLVLVDALRKLRETHIKQAPRRGSCYAFAAERRSVVAAPEPAGQALQELRGACSSKSRLVEIQVSNRIGTITMCNDAKRNALSWQVCLEIQKGLDSCIGAGALVVVLRAKPGVRVWSAGHDIRDFKRIDGTGAESGAARFQDPLSREDAFVQLLSQIRNTPVPVIGCVEGSVWGAATDICACCDMLIGTPSVTFAITPSKIGLPYNSSGMAHFIQVVPLHVVKWMFFTGLPLSSEEALRYGFLNQVVPSEELTAKTEELAATLASRAPLVVQLLKKQITSICSAPALTPDAFEELHEMRRKAWCSDDMEEGVRAFFQKRDPQFSGT